MKNDLKRPVLEEIGARIRSTFMLEGIKNYQQDYIKWALTEATQAEAFLFASRYRYYSPTPPTQQSVEKFLRNGIVSPNSCLN